MVVSVSGRLYGHKRLVLNVYCIRRQASRLNASFHVNFDRAEDGVSPDAHGAVSGAA